MSSTTTVSLATGEARCPGADRILAAARTLFAQRGLSGVSIQQIADAAEVSKANVFHHFATKQALYRAVLDTAAGEFRALLAALGEQTTAQGLNTFAQQHLARLLNDPDTTWLFLRALSDPQTGGTQRRLAEEVVGEAMRAVIAAIGGLQRRAVLPADPPAATLALTLLGANLIYFQLHNVLPRLGDQAALRDPAAFADGVTRLLARTPDDSDLPTSKKAPLP